MNFTVVIAGGGGDGGGGVACLHLVYGFAYLGIILSVPLPAPQHSTVRHFSTTQQVKIANWEHKMV